MTVTVTVTVIELSFSMIRPSSEGASGNQPLIESADVTWSVFVRLMSWRTLDDACDSAAQHRGHRVRRSDGSVAETCDNHGRGIVDEPSGCGCPVLEGTLTQ
jgi:hypothetical protein